MEATLPALTERPHAPESSFEAFLGSPHSTGVHCSVTLRAVLRFPISGFNTASLNEQ